MFLRSNKFINIETAWLTSLGIKTKHEVLEAIKNIMEERQIVNENTAYSSSAT
jgi:hypothetical protein